MTGFDLHGTIKVNVICGSSGKKPRLQGGSKGISFSISKGSAIVQQLMLEANTIGVDGQEYVLLFEAVISGSETLEIEPFKLSFLFYDGMSRSIFIFNEFFVILKQFFIHLSRVIHSVNI